MTKKERKDPSLMDQYLAADWARLRSKGRSQFIWKRFVGPIGIPSAVLGTFVVYYVLNLSAADVMSLKGIGMIYIVFAFTGVSVYRGAAKEWEKRENEYL